MSDFVEEFPVGIPSKCSVWMQEAALWCEPGVSGVGLGVWLLVPCAVTAVWVPLIPAPLLVCVLQRAHSTFVCSFLLLCALGRAAPLWCPFNTNWCLDEILLSMPFQPRRT